MNWEEIKKSGWRVKNKNEVRILSIDGGGIRGIFAAKYLAEIEKVTEKNIYEYFDLITGTSTGGIIALALAVGIKAEEIVEMYEKNAKRIFKQKAFSWMGLFRRKYDNDGLKKILIDKFKENKMNDSKVMLCIPSLEFNNAKPKVYKTEHNKEIFRDGKKEIWKVALATSAAPTYFPAVEVFDAECNIDGGIWANNPSMIGIAEAVKNNFKLDQIKVLSIGTGQNMFRESYKIAKSSSVLKWKGKIVDLILNAQSQSAAFLAKYLIEERFIEINFKLDDKMSMDTTNDEDIKSLLNAAINEFQDSYKKNKCVEKEFFI